MVIAAFQGFQDDGCMGNTQGCLQGMRIILTMFQLECQGEAGLIGIDVQGLVIDGFNGGNRIKQGNDVYAIDTGQEVQDNPAELKVEGQGKIECPQKGEYP